MRKTLHNWAYEDVTNFLKAKGFDFQYDIAGIGNAWMNFHSNGEPNRVVEVKRIDVFYTPKALRKMIRQSGIAEGVWLNWNSRNDKRNTS